jgi:hypothetical protein
MNIRDHGDPGVVPAVEGQAYDVVTGQVCRWRGELAEQFIQRRAIVTVDPARGGMQMPFTGFAPERAYVGAPLYLGGGDLFGALCALAPDHPPAAELAAELPFVALCARLLASLLELQLQAQ